MTGLAPDSFAQLQADGWVLSAMPPARVRQKVLLRLLREESDAGRAVSRTDHGRLALALAARLGIGNLTAIAFIEMRALMSPHEIVKLQRYAFPEREQQEGGGTPSNDNDAAPSADDASRTPMGGDAT